MTTPKTQSTETQSSGSTQLSPSLPYQTAAMNKTSNDVATAIRQFAEIKAALRGPTPIYPLPKPNEKAAATEPAINQLKSQ